MTSHNQSYAIEALLALMARLRDPLHGCPWDLEQSFATIAPYTIEEAYEVADAIARNDLSQLKRELGDLLFQVVFHARLAEEQGAFDFEAVVRGLVAKMESRHPHVFGAASIQTSEAQSANWESLKARERAAQGAQSVLDDVPLALPALLRAEKLTKRAARIGFDWPNAEAVLEKLAEELGELAQARAEECPAHIAEEYGDLLFVVANLGRKLGLQPEEALRQANTKFERRFRALEARLPSDQPHPGLEALEALWLAVKQAERSQQPRANSTPPDSI